MRSREDEVESPRDRERGPGRGRESLRRERLTASSAAVPLPA